MTFYEELLLKIIDSLIIGVLILFVGYWLNRGLEKFKSKEEYQRQLAQSKINAYQRLWSLMETVRPSREGEITYDERARLAERLRSWYYDDGNGLYLPHKTAGVFIDSRDALLDKNITDDQIKEQFSKLRTQMKIDAGVYDQKEAQIPISDRQRA